MCRRFQLRAYAVVLMSELRLRPGCSTTRTARRLTVHSTARTTARTTFGTTRVFGARCSVGSLLWSLLRSKKSFRQPVGQSVYALFGWHFIRFGNALVTSKAGRHNLDDDGAHGFHAGPAGQIQNAGDVWASSLFCIMTNTHNIR